MYLVWRGAGVWQCFPGDPHMQHSLRRVAGGWAVGVTKAPPEAWLGRPEPTRSGALFSTWVGGCSGSGTHLSFSGHAA